MTKEFETDYARKQAIIADFNNSATEEERDRALAEMAEFRADLDKKSVGYGFVFELYSDAQENGNKYIDISEYHDYENETELIATLRQHGIEEFTFSSTYSSAVESAWAFQQAGCTLEGMVEVNKHFNIGHGFLFKIN